jgi:hypothetical protein
MNTKISKIPAEDLEPRENQSSDFSTDKEEEIIFSGSVSGKISHYKESNLLQQIVIHQSQ